MPRHEREAGYHGEATTAADGNDAPENHGQSARGGEAWTSKGAHSGLKA